MTEETNIARILQNAGEAFTGNEGAEEMARQWHEAGFTASELQDWMIAGCFEPEAARELADHGIDPVQAKREIELHGQRRSIGYWVANNDLRAEVAMKWLWAEQATPISKEAFERELDDLANEMSAEEGTQS